MGSYSHCRVTIPSPTPPCRVCHQYLFIQPGEKRQSGVKANPNPKPSLKQHSGQGLNPGPQDPEFIKELTTYTPPYSKTRFNWNFKVKLLLWQAPWLKWISSLVLKGLQIKNRQLEFALFSKDLEFVLKMKFNVCLDQGWSTTTKF